jgi:hypothetical protein
MYSAKCCAKKLVCRSLLSCIQLLASRAWCNDLFFFLLGMMWSYITGSLAVDPRTLPERASDCYIVHLMCFCVCVLLCLLRWLIQKRIANLLPLCITRRRKEKKKERKLFFPRKHRRTTLHYIKKKKEERPNYNTHGTPHHPKIEEVILKNKKFCEKKKKKNNRSGSCPHHAVFQSAQQACSGIFLYLTPSVP